MVKAEKKIRIRIDRWYSIVYLRSSSNSTTFKFWSSICCLWGIFVVMAMIWGLIIDKNRPDRFEIVGGAVVLLGALVIFYAPRQ